MKKLPKDLVEYFGCYDACFYDPICGEPVAWGYPVLRQLGEELWAKAQTLGTLECDHDFDPKWFLITRYLTPAEARKQYGEVTNVEVGPRGGFRTVTYGTKQFFTKRLDPRQKR
jgi:hypothetical protein